MTVKNVVLVHGAFADGSSWAGVIPALRAAGLNPIAAQSPLSSLADDVSAVHRAIEKQDGPVLLVGHSWGGAVITEAGNHPQVIGLVYVAAAAPDSGQSFNDWWKDYPSAPGAAEIKPYGEGYVALTEDGVKSGFAQDVPASQAELIFATQGPLAVRCFDDKNSEAAWHDKPSWYVVADKDRIIPPAVQHDSAERLGATTLVLASSHVPMVSRPAEVAEFIISAANSIDA